jgi:hypothetical protein
MVSWSRPDGTHRLPVYVESVFESVGLDFRVGLKLFLLLGLRTLVCRSPLGSLEASRGNLADERRPECHRPYHPIRHCQRQLHRFPFRIVTTATIAGLQLAPITTSSSLPSYFERPKPLQRSQLSGPRPHNGPTVALTSHCRSAFTAPATHPAAAVNANGHTINRVHFITARRCWVVFHALHLPGTASPPVS